MIVFSSALSLIVGVFAARRGPTFTKKKKNHWTHLLFRFCHQCQNYFSQNNSEELILFTFSFHIIRWYIAATILRTLYAFGSGTKPWFCGRVRRGLAADGRVLGAPQQLLPAVLGLPAGLRFLRRRADRQREEEVDGTGQIRPLR